MSEGEPGTASMEAPSSQLLSLDDGEASTADGVAAEPMDADAAPTPVNGVAQEPQVLIVQADGPAPVENGNGVTVEVQRLTEVIQFLTSNRLKETISCLAKEMGFEIAGLDDEVNENVVVTQTPTAMPSSSSATSEDKEKEKIIEESNSDKKVKIMYGVVRDDMPAIGSDKKKKKDPKDNKKKDLNAPPPDRIPLPSVPESVVEERRQAYRESIKKGRITADNPPSICLYNAHNTNGGLTTAQISENCSLLALGLNDGRVIINSLADDHIKLLKHSNNLNLIDQDMDEIDGDIYDDMPAEQRNDRITLTAHVSAVTSSNFSPDRRVLLTGSLDRTARLWCIDMRRELVVYKHATAVHRLSFCNRGLYFASSSADHSVMLWTTERINPLRIYTEPFGSTLALDFHPNCNYIVGGSEDSFIRIWDVLGPSCVKTFTGHKSGIRGIKTSPDGRHIVSISEDGALHVWDIGQQKLAAVQQCDPTPVKVPIEFTRDGSVFAVGTPHAGISFFSLDSLISGEQTEPKMDPPSFLIHQYLTKRTPVLDMQFLKRNTVVCVGAFEQ